MGYAPSAVAIADLNGDGFEDLAIGVIGQNAGVETFRGELFEKASASISVANHGPHEAFAEYRGDTNYEPSRSCTINLLAPGEEHSMIEGGWLIPKTAFHRSKLAL